MNAPRLSMLLLLMTAPLAAQNTRPDASMDGVLDRLERKLMEQEASTLRLTPLPRIKPERPAQRNIDLPTQAISAPLPEQRDFQAIDQQIKDLEQETDELSGQVEKLKTDLQVQASKASLVEIVAELSAPEETSLRDFAFSINKHTIYQIQSGEGPWMPGSQILLYTGPLEPGEHIVQLKGRTVRRYGEGLPLDQNLYHRYDQSFRISIPQGSFRKGYRFKLAKPEEQNIHAQAILETYEIP